MSLLIVCVTEEGEAVQQNARNEEKGKEKKKKKTGSGGADWSR
jgi:hypothetical protein